MEVLIALVSCQSLSLIILKRILVNRLAEMLFQCVEITCDKSLQTLIMSAHVLSKQFSKPNKTIISLYGSCQCEYQHRNSLCVLPFQLCLGSEGIKNLRQHQIKLEKSWHLLHIAFMLQFEKIRLKTNKQWTSQCCPFSQFFRLSKPHLFGKSV